jgi:hypothetical protein
VDAWKSPSEAISLLRKCSVAHQEAGNNGSVPAWLRAPLLTIPAHVSLISVCHKASETYRIIICVCLQTVAWWVFMKFGLKHLQKGTR